MKLSDADLARGAPCPEIYYEATGDEPWPDTAAELSLIRERDAGCHEPLAQIQADRRTLLRLYDLGRTADGLRDALRRDSHPTIAQIETLLHDLPIDLGDRQSVIRLLKVVWDAVTDVEDMMHERPNDGRMMLLHNRIKTAFTAVVHD